MPKRSATRNVTRGILCAASVLIFPGLSPSSMAQGPTNQQSTGRAPAAATIDGATAAAIAAEGELKATIRTFQSDNPSAVVLLAARQPLRPLSVERLSVGCIRLLPALTGCSRSAVCCSARPHFV